MAANPAITGSDSGVKAPRNALANTFHENISPCYANSTVCAVLKIRFLPI